ncbi:S-layer homology domain-containing protein [Paenibacillus hexagrammi]|uniref:S-layer homology domain-containing protein n=1 Tax=Paenibacillus hexagrammi TaxID=2908839 RepID=A0ABY3STY9_9BACL|nr:S-layer homology domain-containing protein [Paenibacillus sp. YPD9-1]UJF36417.1 S-layer homology domain-containing protein [Paenibacillus sp. YPD9-1]
MKNLMKRIWIVGMSAAIYALNMHPVLAEDISFRDIPTDFWGFSSIRWAVESKIVEGYSDDTFRPDQPVTGTEFIAMLIRCYQADSVKQEAAGSSDWSDAYVTYWSRLGWGVADQHPLSRGQAAIFAVNAAGKNYVMNDAIQYVLDHHIAEGKTSHSIDGFLQEDLLTRAEAVTFIQKLKESNMSLASKVVVPTITYTIKNMLTVELPASWEGKYEVESAISEDTAETFDFFNKDNREYGGLLFTIKIWPKERWEANEDLTGIVKISKIGEFGDQAVTISFPSDVNFSLDDANLKQQYQDMYEDIKNQNVIITILQP